MAAIGKVTKCKNCSNEFTVTREWQLFCSNSCRISYNKQNYGMCFYCGSPGTHRDHVDPAIYCGRRHFDRVEFVLACKDCNSALYSHRFDDVSQRFRYLASVYKSRISSERHWDKDELKELGPTLRKNIKQKMKADIEKQYKFEYLMAMAESFDKNES